MFTAGSSVDLAGMEISFAPTSEPNLPPTAEIRAEPAQGVAPLTVALTAVASDPEGLSLNYSWDLGDRTVASEAATSKVYEFPGDYTVTLEVTDGEGEVAIATTVIRVFDPSNPDGPDDGDDDTDGPDPHDGDEPTPWPDDDSDGSGLINGMSGGPACSAAPVTTLGASPQMGGVLLGFVVLLLGLRRRL